MILKNSILIFSLFLCCSAFGRDSIPLSNKFKFNDGAYESFESLRNNVPEHVWQDLEVNLFTNPKNKMTKVASIQKHRNDTLEAVNLNGIWALSTEGKPYLKLDPKETGSEMAVFVPLRVRGKICFFTYPKEKDELVEISAYNPVTGRPFRTGKVKRAKEVWVEKILNFETGEIADFNKENLLGWIEDDQKLWQTVKEFSADEAKDKLFKSLKIYDDRNPIFVKM